MTVAQLGERSTARYLANVHRYPVGAALDAAVAWACVFVTARVRR